MIGFGCTFQSIWGISVNTIYIKFNNREHQVRGYYELATKASVSSLPDGIYVVPVKALQILDDQHISYRRATDEEVKRANAQAQNPADPVYPKYPNKPEGIVR